MSEACERIIGTACDGRACGRVAARLRGQPIPQPRRARPRRRGALSAADDDDAVLHPGRHRRRDVGRTRAVLERDLRLRRLHQLRPCGFLRHRRVHHGDPDAARARLELLGDSSGRGRGRRRRCGAGRLAGAAAEGRVLRDRDLGAGRGGPRAHHSPRLHRWLRRTDHADPPRRQLLLLHDARRLGDRVRRVLSAAGTVPVRFPGEGGTRQRGRRPRAGHQHHAGQDRGLRAERDHPRRAWAASTRTGSPSSTRRAC